MVDWADQARTKFAGKIQVGKGKVQISQQKYPAESGEMKTRPRTESQRNTDLRPERKGKRS